MRPNFITNLRKKNQFTQEYLAKTLGISRQTYGQIERGERDITVPELSKLAAIFDLSIDDLVNEREVKTEIIVTHKKQKMIVNNTRINIPQEKLDKFEQVFLYMLKKVGGKPNIGETVLYKLLYFIDFDYYEKYEEQLMGLHYKKNHFGPTPINFKQVVQDMINSNKIENIKSKFYQHEQKKYLINPCIEPDLSILNGQEKEHIDWELQRLSNQTATQLSDFSHQDTPWITAQQGEILDYEAVFYRTKDTSVRNYNLDDTTCL